MPLFLHILDVAKENDPCFSQKWDATSKHGLFDFLKGMTTMRMFAYGRLARIIIDEHTTCLPFGSYRLPRFIILALSSNHNDGGLIVS